MRFPYRAYQDLVPTPADRSAMIDRPAVRVHVFGLRGDLELWGVLDTGATECVLPYSVHEQVEAARRADDFGWLAGYVGDPRPIPYGTLDLEIVLKGRPQRWSAKVALDPEREGEALWGIAGFLEHFTASFNGPGRHVTLRRTGTTPRPILPRSPAQ